MQENGEAASIKEQINAASKQLNSLDSVASIVAPFEGGTKIDDALRWVRKHMPTTEVDRKNYGVVSLADKWLREGLGYTAKKANEIAAILALPAVIKRGIEIGHSDNHKGRGFSTTTFAAPVEVNGVRGNMAVVVKETKLKHYHAHRILMPNEQVFAIPEMENAEPSTAVGQSLKEIGFDTPISSASDTRIADNGKSVNPSDKKTIKRDVKVSDAAYMDAVKRGDMEAAQRMVHKAAERAMKGTVIVNNDGSLMVVYHQTQNEFTVFDIHHNGPGTSDYKTPFGIFMKPDAGNIGIRGDIQMPLYADIKNPLRVSNRQEFEDHLLNDAQYRALYEEIQNRTPIYEAKLKAADQAITEFMSKWRKENPTAGRKALYEVDEFNRLQDKKIDWWMNGNG